MNVQDGSRIIRFSEAFCRISSGVGAGSLISLRLWQKRLLLDLAKSQARRAYIQMPRKNGKSQLAAILGLYGLIADGEPAALVVSAAADREQARIVFGTARRMVETNEHLSKMVRVYRNELVVPETDSRYRVLSADAHTKEGMNVSLALIDELHAHPSRDLYDVLSLSTGARENPLVLAITTPGARYDRFGQDSVCYQLYDYSKKLGTGEVVDEDFFYRIWEPEDPACDVGDREAWAQSNPALGDFLHTADLEAAVRITPENEFATKRLGQWRASQEAWLPAGAWAACEDAGEREPMPIVLGFDGSFSGDSTALIGATVEEHPYVFMVGVWEKPPNVSAAWRINHDEVQQEVLAACGRHQVKEVVCDPHLWQRDMEAWAKLGVPVVEFPQGPARMVPASQRFFEAVKSGVMRHDGDKVLARHLGNAYVKQTPSGPKVSKENKDSGRKIDAAIAAILAYDRAAVLGNAPPSQLKVW